MIGPGAELRGGWGGEGTPEALELAAAELGARRAPPAGAGRALLADALDLRHRLLPPGGAAAADAGAGRRGTGMAGQEGGPSRPGTSAATPPDRLMRAVAGLIAARFPVEPVGAGVAGQVHRGRSARRRKSALGCGRRSGSSGTGPSTEHGLKTPGRPGRRRGTRILVHGLGQPDRGDPAAAGLHRHRRCACGPSRIGILARSPPAPSRCSRTHREQPTHPDDPTPPRGPGCVVRRADSVVDQVTPPQIPRLAGPGHGWELHVHLSEEALLARHPANPGQGGAARTAGRWAGHRRARLLPVPRPRSTATSGAPPVIDATREPAPARRYSETASPADAGSRRSRQQPASTVPWGTWCQPAGRDLDHTIPYRSPGLRRRATRPDRDRENLGPLGRTEHRLKTHGRWRLRQPASRHLPGGDPPTGATYPLPPTPALKT